MAFSYAHYDQPDVYGNYAYLGQIQEADETWREIRLLAKFAMKKNHLSSYWISTKDSTL